MQNNYRAINASAGSGKTYALVQRILMICLENPHQQDKIKNILALTFTNKAANEMKERILLWLKKFSGEKFEKDNELQDIQKKFLENGKNISLKDLHLRSKKVLDYILHHYSTLNIGTIDKFNAKLVRSFSYELGLAHQFNLEINPEPYLIEAVDQMLDNIGKDEKISEAFMDFVNYSLENEEKINLNTSLYQKAKNWVNDVHYEELQKNQNFDWKSYENSKENLRKSIAQHWKNIKEIALNSLKIIELNNLTISDFAQGKNGIGGFFEKTIDRNQPPLSKTSTEEENFISRISKGASGSGKNKESEIFSILDILIKNREEIIKNYILAEKKSKILKELLPFKINKEIQDELQKIEEENDLVLLSKFNILISENLKNEPSSFIYEKIGTRFQHYFLDEFQDTSALQWENLIPLKEHTVSSEEHSFTLVGDPKQSIYRFRGGDSELMLNIINHKEETNIPAKVEVLENNYRSSENIVKFNNELYQFISENTDLSEEHQTLFGEKAQQIPQKNRKGRVKIELLEQENVETFYDEASEKMHENIQELVNQGFDLQDIAILCKTSKEIQGFSKRLSTKKIIYHDKEIYIKSISDKGLRLDLSLTILAVIEFLRWETQPKNRQFLVKMMYYLWKSERISIEDFSKEMTEILSQKSTKEIGDFLAYRYNLNIFQEDLQLNIYNTIESKIKEFSVPEKETDFILSFLEMLYSFTQNPGITLKDFIKYWDEEAYKISIQTSENVDAIQLYTIHASKGLEFPVVFLPMKNASEKRQSKDYNWFETQETENLKSVHLTNFDSSFEVYDDSIKDFNQENEYRKKIDRFCLQYVATTRAVEQMFLYLQKPGKTNYLEIMDFVKTKNNTEDSFDFEEVNDFDKLKNTDKEKALQKTFSVKLSSDAGKQNNIHIATPSKSYQKRNEKVREGIFAHEILAKISTEKDLEKVVEKYFLDGVITSEEKKSVTERIKKIISEHPIYFDEEAQIFNEREILTNTGNNLEIYRPDRIVVKNNEWFLVDFKTGDDAASYKKQLSDYQKILEKMGKKVVKAELVFV